MKTSLMLHTQIVQELLISGALALWPPVVLAGLKTPIHTRTFFAWWAFVWLCLLTFGSIITFFLKRFGEAGGNLLQTLFLVLQARACPNDVACSSIVELIPSSADEFGRRQPRRAVPVFLQECVGSRLIEYS